MQALENDFVYILENDLIQQLRRLEIFKFCYILGN